MTVQGMSAAGASHIKDKSLAILQLFINWLFQVDSHK